MRIKFGAHFAQIPEAFDSNFRCRAALGGRAEPPRSVRERGRRHGFRPATADFGDRVLGGAIGFL